MMLEDREPGSVTMLANDQLFALGPDTRGRPQEHHVQVYGHRYDMEPVILEMAFSLGWLDARFAANRSIEVVPLQEGEDVRAKGRHVGVSCNCSGIQLVYSGVGLLQSV